MINRPLLPQEIDELTREAKHEGYVQRMRQENRELEQAKLDLKSAHRVLWALASQSDEPLRVSRTALVGVEGADCQLQTLEDLATGDLLIRATTKEPR